MFALRWLASEPDATALMAQLEGVFDTLRGLHVFMVEGGTRDEPGRRTLAFVDGHTHVPIEEAFSLQVTLVEAGPHEILVCTRGDIRPLAAASAELLERGIVTADVPEGKDPISDPSIIHVSTFTHGRPFHPAAHAFFRKVLDQGHDAQVLLVANLQLELGTDVLLPHLLAVETAWQREGRDDEAMQTLHAINERLGAPLEMLPGRILRDTTVDQLQAQIEPLIGPDGVEAGEGFFYAGAPPQIWVEVRETMGGVLVRSAPECPKAVLDALVPDDAEDIEGVWARLARGDVSALVPIVMLDPRPSSRLTEALRNALESNDPAVRSLGLRAILVAPTSWPRALAQELRERGEPVEENRGLLWQLLDAPVWLAGG